MYQLQTTHSQQTFLTQRKIQISANFSVSPKSALAYHIYPLKSIRGQPRFKMMTFSFKIVAITLVITQMVLLLAPISAAQEGDSIPRADVTTSKRFIQEALNRQNFFRWWHHQRTPRLTLSDDLCSIAQAYANKLAANDKIELIHSSNGYGENLYWSADEINDGYVPVEKWNSEGTGYNYNIDYQPGTNNFTQMLWKGTKEMGIAKATGKAGTFVVANYYPKGNVIGQFIENVAMD